MSQYGYIPNEKANELKESYSIANPSTWTFEKNGVQYGGVEEYEFSEAQKEEITALGGNWFEDASAFLNWMNR